MKVRAYAKINLALDVVRKRDDGYHDLEMIMAPLEFHDLIFVDQIESGILIESDNRYVPCDERNIVYKVASLMINTYDIKKGVRIYIHKHIPMQAGLGGGSADGAAVMLGVNRLFKLNLSLEEMAELGKTVGADIPFCLYNKLAYVEGIGEKIQLIESDFSCDMLLVKPRIGVSTKAAFSNLDYDNLTHASCKELKLALENNDYNGVVNNLKNSLEQNIPNEIKVLKRELEEFGFDGVLMTGSGSCVFAISQNQELLQEAYLHFKNKYRFVKKTRIKRA